MITTVKRGLKPLCFFQGDLLYAVGNTLYIADANFQDAEKVVQLEVPRLVRPMYHVRLLVRLLRLLPSYARQVTATMVLVSHMGHAHLIDVREKKIVSRLKFRDGMRNFLSCSEIKGIPSFDPQISFGEYLDNNARTPVSIWSINLQTEGKWEKRWTFPQGSIKHIHAIVPDEYRGWVWILTGDVNGEVGMWAAKNNFTEVTRVVFGKQIFRACSAFPVREGLLYATDSQYESNSICILEQEGSDWVSRHIADIAGPCIYSTQVGDDYIFATAVEPGMPKSNVLRTLLDCQPGPGLNGNYSEVFVGNLSKGFVSICRMQKDMWPARLFQFGSISFPSGTPTAEYVLAYGTALKGIDDVCFKLNVSS